MFDIKKRLSLSFLGEGWEDCYLDFQPTLIGEMGRLGKLQPKSEEDNQRVIEDGIEFLKDKFITGKALKDGKLVDVKKEDLMDFPVEVINKVFSIFGGELDKKK